MSFIQTDKNNEPLLSVKDIHKTFNKNTENEIEIFKGLSMDVKKGELVAILGGNGCGKSTLFNIISRSLDIDGGEISLGGELLNSKKEEDIANLISKVHQNPSLGVSPSLTILENLSLADKKIRGFGLKKLLKNTDRERYVSLLKDLDLGLEKKLNVKVKHLSGGQRQALSLLMATIHPPKLLLLDEHTAALDPKTSSLIMKKTKELIDRDHITALMISHNLRDAIEYSSRIVMLRDGGIILNRPSNSITEEELIRIYTENVALS